MVLFGTHVRRLAGFSPDRPCFLAPKWRPDGSRNQIHIQRLKDKLGDRSNASSEVEFRGAYAQMIGAEGRGVPTILDMVMHTRLDCMTGSAALVRQAVAQAIHHAMYREALKFHYRRSYSQRLATMT